MQVPGGAGVFPSLTVDENLRLAGWLRRKDDPEGTETALTRAIEHFPILGQRGHEPAGDLSGGQQQMLALGMALIARPKLLMIDELSLGLAPVVVEHLLPLVREIRDDGTTVILVEQSVNLALTVADRAYFMEKGEIRFQGPTAELLERPDVLRSVFLEGAGANGAGRPKAKVRRRESERPVEESGPAIAIRGPHPELRRPHRRRRRDLLGPTGRDRRVHRPERRRQDDAVRPDQRVRPRRPGHRAPGRRRHHRLLGGRTGPAGPRPLVPGRPPVPGAHRRGDDRRRPRALDRRPGPVNPALHLPAAFDSEEQVRERVDELIELFGLGAFRSKFVRELSTGSRRVVDLACVVAHRPTVVLLDEPSSGIAQRETEALGPLLQRLRDGLGAALLVIEHDVPLVTGVADRIVAMDQGVVIADGLPDEVLSDGAVVASYLGSDRDAIARSGVSPGGDT